MGIAPATTALPCVGKAVGQSLQRPADLAARYGGDEFVVLLPVTDTDGALDVAQRVLAAIAALDIPHGASPFGRVTSSIGVAQVVPGPNNTSQELLERADRALYAAKQAGRNRVMADADVLVRSPRRRLDFGDWLETTPSRLASNRRAALWCVNNTSSGLRVLLPRCA